MPSNRSVDLTADTLRRHTVHKYKHSFSVLIEGLLFLYHGRALIHRLFCF